MTDTETGAGAAVAQRLNTIIHQLATAGVHLSQGQIEAARDHVAQANISLTALRVRLDRIIGPDRLAQRKRRR